MKNFGKIKNSFNILLSESITLKKNEGKTLFKGYVKQIKENKILSTQFLIYKNIEDMVEENETKIIELIKENISLMDKYSTKEIEKANNSLFEGYLSGKEFGDIYGSNEKLKALHEDISKLILTKRKANTINDIVDATYRVSEYIKGKKPKSNDNISEGLNVPNSMITSVFVEKFNEKYKDLNESELKVVNLVVESTSEEKEEFYKDTIRDCITLIDETLVSSDLLVKESLLAAKDNLLRREYNDDKFIKDITKILNLKKDLKQ
tara:strand:- start:2238 stop:3029 length:792 start_codon:yes stop_codon:yes gene_type:complete